MSSSGCVRAIVLMAVIAGVAWIAVTALSGGGGTASGEAIAVDLSLEVDSAPSRPTRSQNGPVEVRGWVNVSSDVWPDDCHIAVWLEGRAPWPAIVSPSTCAFTYAGHTNQTFFVKVVVPPHTTAGNYDCTIHANATRTILENATYYYVTVTSEAHLTVTVEQYYLIDMRFLDGWIDIRPNEWVTQRLFIVNTGNGPDVLEVSTAVLSGDMVERIETEGPFAVPSLGSVNTTIRYLIGDDLDIRDGETCSIEVRVDSQGARNAGIDYEQNAIATLRYPPAVERVVDMGIINLFVAVASIVLLTLLLVYLLFWRYGRARKARGDANLPADGKVGPGARK